MNCDKCVHAGICKNETKFRAVESKIVDEIAIELSGNEIDDVAFMNIRCKNFKMKWQKKPEKTTK